MLNLRSKNAGALTMKAAATDLVHLGQALEFEGLSDLNARLEDGRYLNDFEIESLVENMGIQTSLLRRLNDPKVIRADRKRLLEKARATINATKARRITITAKYIDLVARTGEAQASPSERRKRSGRRTEIVKYFMALRPKGRSSRIRNAISEDDLARVVAFVATGDPSEIWSNLRIRDRNWAIVTLLVFCGLRSSEVRQLRADDR